MEKRLKKSLFFVIFLLYLVPIFSEHLIYKDWFEKRITLNNFCKYIIYKYSNPSTLPLRYQNDIKGKREVSIFFHIVLRNWENVSGENKESLSALYSRPTDADYKANGVDMHYTGTHKTYSTTHFVIHWEEGGAQDPDLTDNNGNTIPDYVENVADKFEYAYAYEINTMGYDVPPQDQGGGDPGDPDTKYDIFILDTVGRLNCYGYCDPDTNNIVNNKCPSFIAIDNNLDEDKLKTTSVHEYFHAIQFGMNCYTETWYMECSSTWIMEYIYDNINDAYDYLYLYFDYPEQPLDLNDGSMHWYGTWIFNEYIRTRWGADTILDIWNQIKTELNASNQDPLGPINTVFTNNATNLQDVFLDFACRNYDTSYYDEPENMTSIKISRTINSYPATTSVVLDHMGAGYIKFNLSALTGALFLQVDGPDSISCGYKILAKRGGSYLYFSVDPDKNNDFYYTISPIGYSDITLIMVNSSTTSSYDNKVFYITASVTSAGLVFAGGKASQKGCFVSTIMEK